MTATSSTGLPRVSSMHRVASGASFAERAASNASSCSAMQQAPARRIIEQTGSRNVVTSFVVKRVPSDAQSSLPPAQSVAARSVLTTSAAPSSPTSSHDSRLP